MRYSLRTLLILLLMIPPALAVIFWEAKAFGLQVLFVEAIVLGIVAVAAFCFSFLFWSR
jgi:hypothetical protein